METNYITIECEFGSGGDIVAERLAKDLGIPCYDKEVREIAAQNMNITVPKLVTYEENVLESLLYSIVMSEKMKTSNSDMLTGENRVFIEEQRAICQLSQNGPAVFLGYCAADVLKNKSKVINVFICADPDKKRNRIIKDYGILEESAESIMKQTDKKRARYTLVSTGKRWNNPDIYDVILDSSKLELDDCVSVIKSHLSDKQALNFGGKGTLADNSSNVRKGGSFNFELQQINS